MSTPLDALLAHSGQAPQPLDARTAEQVLARMALLAQAMAGKAASDEAAEIASQQFPQVERLEWLQDLFSGADDAQPLALRDTGEASSALLSALAGVLISVVGRYNRLPQQWYDQFIRQHLGQQPTAARPDTILVAFTTTPPGNTMSLAAGTLIIAEDANKKRRRYATDHGVVVRACVLADLVGYQGCADGRALLVRHALAGGKMVQPIRPFGDPLDPTVEWVLPNWYLGGAALRAGRPSMRWTLVMIDAGPDPKQVAELLSDCRWTVSSADEPLVLAAPVVTCVGTTVEATITFTAVPVAPKVAVPGLPLGEPFLCISLTTPAMTASAQKITCAEIRCRCAGEAITATRLFVNGSPLDATQPFLPFGPVPTPGANFAIADDTLLALPLKTLSVRITPVEAAYPDWQTEPVGTAAGGVLWESGREGEWRTLLPDPGLPITTFGGVQDLSPDPTRAASVIMPLGTTSARFLRCRLVDADFGWQEYQLGVADFSAWAASKMPGAPNFLQMLGKGGKRLGSLLGVVKDPTPELPIPPVPPLCSRVQLTFASADMPLGADLFTRGGPAQIEPVAVPRTSSGRLRPFFHGVDGWNGLLFGCLTGSIPSGELTLYLTIAATPAERSAHGQLLLYIMNGAGQWMPLDIVDQTNAFSQSGFIRFHAPSDWGIHPSPYLGARTQGRWFLLVTNMPQNAGMLSSVAFNAVSATGLVADVHDASYATPLPVAAAMRLERVLTGLGPVQLLRTLIAGSSPESTPAFHRRSAGLIRHRQRAVTPWDVERLLKDRFAQIRLVRCLRTAPAANDPPGGILRVVVVPDDADPYPQLEAALREEIATWLASIAPKNATITLSDPTFTAVRISARLRVSDGVTLDGARQAVEASLASRLHPLSSAGGLFGFDQPLLLHRVEHLLSRLPEVSLVEQVAFIGRASGELVIMPAGPADLITCDGHHRVEMLPKLEVWP